MPDARVQTRCGKRCPRLYLIILAFHHQRPSSKPFPRWLGLCAHGMSSIIYVEAHSAISFHPQRRSLNATSGHLYSNLCEHMGEDDSLGRTNVRGMCPFAALFGSLYVDLEDYY